MSVFAATVLLPRLFIPVFFRLVDYSYFDTIDIFDITLFDFIAFLHSPFISLIIDYVLSFHYCFLLRHFRCR